MEIKTKEMFKVTFGKDLNAIHMYFLKHLNRYNVVRMDIPKWTNNDWENNKLFKIQEVPKGSYFKSEFLIQMGVKSEDLNKKLTIYYELFDKQTRMPLEKGFYEDRNGMFEYYIAQMKKAKTLQEQLIGVVPNEPRTTD